MRKWSDYLALNFLPDLEKWKFWLLCILLIRAVFFIYFAYHFHTFPESKTLGLFVIYGDTPEYFDPIAALIQGGELSPCRMPGFLPIYGPLIYLFDEWMARNGVIIFQFLISVLSIYVLGLISNFTTGSQRISKWVMLLYSMSVYVFLWDHHGLADSFHVSFLLFAVYFFQKGFSENRLWLIAFSGFFFTWSMFMRVITIVPFGLLLLFLIGGNIFQKGSKSKTALQVLAFIFPFLLIDGAWVTYNFKQSERIIPLYAPLGECFEEWPPHQYTLLKLPVGWGGEFTPWGKEAEWFLRNTMKENEFPFSEEVFTETYNLDSLIHLRRLHLASLDPDVSALEREKLISEVETRAKKYLAAYREEHPFDFYVTNKFKLLSKFYFSTRMEGWPFPRFADMVWHQKILKAFNHALYFGVSAFGLLGLLFSFRKRKFIPIQLVVIGISAFLIGYLGFMELRYFVPLFPFLLLLAVYTIYQIAQRMAKVLLSSKTE